MKLNYIFLLSGIGIASLLSSCDSDKDFLTENPKSILTIENGYSNSDQVLATVLSAYHEYEEFFFNDNAFAVGTMIYKMGGTDVMDGNDQSIHFSNFKNTWSSTASHPKAIWDKYYKMISYCNLALGQIENVAWSDEASKNRVAAEAKFLRGVAYLRLAIYFGNVPLEETFSETAKFDYTCTPRVEVYKFAIDNMIEAYNILPEKVSSEYGRAGKGAVAMYLSEAFLALGVAENNSTYYGEKDCWENAAEFAQKVIDIHPLQISRFGIRLPDATGSNQGINNAFPQGNVCSDLFVSQNVVNSANTEAVWVAVAAPNYNTYAVNGGRRSTTVAFSPAVQDMQWADAYKEAGSEGPWKSVSSKYGGRTNPEIHGGYGWATYPPTWFASVDVWNSDHNYGTTDDDRYTESVTVRTKFLVCDERHSMYEQYAGWENISKSDANSASKYCPIFYKETPLDAWDWDANDPGLWGAKAYYYRNKYICRSAEAYLLLAEAQLRMGDAAAATTTLNTLRTRAHANPIIGTADIQVILDERARELMLEEDRWATLLRMNPDEWKPRILKYGMYTATEADTKYPDIRRWNSGTTSIDFTLWPIPQTYIDLNVGVKWEQNEGWN